MTHKNKSHHEDHGSISSYVIGFVLSLIYTFIPYYLVVNKIFTGSNLIFVILGIGVLQMAIQLFFFLHLGRGPKPLYNVIFFFATAGVIVITIGASIFIMDNLYRNMSPEEVVLRVSQEENIAQINEKVTGACNENKDNHTITIKNGKADPTYVEAKLCDTLSFTNEDNETVEIIFGSTENQVSYGGLYEVTARSGRAEVITLNQSGVFTFASHDVPGLVGSFSVTEE